jgi:bacteriocin biosynthesis cyclodehydratase domain-containing protein
VDEDPVLRWRSGLARTVRGPHALQLGVGSGAAVLDGLSARDWDLLTLLERGPRRSALPVVAARLGLPTARAEQLLAALLAQGAVVATGTGPPRRTGGPRGRGPRPWAGVAGAGTAVVGGGGLGIALTVALAAAGAAGAAHLDHGTVRAEDVLPGGAQHADVGRRRAHVAAEAVHRVRPDVRTACPSVPDLVVLVSDHVPDAPAGIPLVQQGTVHLPVVLRPDEVVVGPLVVPGAGPCLHCLDLHRRDVDAGWPAAVDQLRASRQAAPAPPPEVSAVVTGMCLTLLQGPPAGVPPTLAGVEVVVSGSGRTDWGRWPPHPSCGCVGLPDPDPGARAGGDGSERASAGDPLVPSGGPGATMAA